MKPILIAGIIIVNLALVSYTIFIFSERKIRTAANNVLTFLTIGVILDITSTICMIIGSSNNPFTLHGILGYSSLAGMLVESILVWRRRIKYGKGGIITKSLHTYSMAAYIWWIAAYVTGAALVAMK
jgi:uncharacterized repeat protein (TIGR03987 family)